MTILKTDSDSALKTADALRSGKIVIIPTDTVYGFSGLVCSQFDSKALIFAAKGRAENKPLIQLVSSVEMLSRYTKDVLPEELAALWPGPLTVIMNNLEGGTTAFRCPGEKWLRDVIELSGGPLYSTSVNKSGEPVLYDVRRMEEVFAQDVALIVDGGNADPDAKPSTIVALSDGEVKIIRQGALSVPSHLLSGKQL